jgi:hypothetical protein
MLTIETIENRLALAKGNEMKLTSNQKKLARLAAGGKGTVGVIPGSASKPIKGNEGGVFVGEHFWWGGLVPMNKSYGMVIAEWENKGKNMLTIRNDFTNCSAKINASKPLTKRKIMALRRNMLSNGCCSGDELGGRGNQDEGYESFLLRAQYVMMSGTDE